MTGKSPRRGMAQTSQSKVDPYDSRNRWDIKSSEGCIIRVIHLHSKAELACWRWWMPSPPSANGRHTELQATRAPPLPGSVPRQKKLRMALSMRRRTPTGIRKADIKYIGMAERTAFTRIMRPPRDSSLPRQPPRRFSTFSTTGCQSLFLRWQSVNGRPKYRIGRVSISVANISAQRCSSSGASPNPTKEDLARFSWRLEKSASISIIWERVRAAVSDP